MSHAAVLAVDGGNSKTDVALVNADGSVLALVRGPLSSPQHLGVDGALTVVEGLLREALREVQLGDGIARIAQVATLLMVTRRADRRCRQTRNSPTIGRTMNQPISTAIKNKPSALKAK